MKTIGVIGGLSWESTAIYYRLLNEEVRARLGGLHSARLLVLSFDFAEIEALQAEEDWEKATRAMEQAAQGLVAGGAELMLIASNTMHKMADAVEAAAGIPLLHIADGTGRAVRAAGCRRPALLATGYTMEQDFYRGRLRTHHELDVLVPDAADRQIVHRIIYDELCQGIVRPESKQVYLDVVARLRVQGADSVILGCTEICMLLSQGDLDCPAFDTTALHARWAVDTALNGQGRT
ncbi:MAG TPA: aspartate/glutamate racemase family protein [Geminicoccus sp.]|uniref:aspartate/glutamate racemase family protein n=1 Tax=Geminicoccus sp. TaxID=2024832 RepID=UPI002E337A91|nr:aspartate/glutamate racemase family protein [Geminicoccus sp.]HEX2525976.1 aspartate/glutamate racemase family protein [Geminicoccus sp.]